MTLVYRPFSSTTQVSQHQSASILDYIEAKDDEGGGDNWSYKTYKPSVKSSPPTHHQSPKHFHRPDALPDGPTTE